MIRLLADPNRSLRSPMPSPGVFLGALTGPALRRVVATRLGYVNYNDNYYEDDPNMDDSRPGYPWWTGDSNWFGINYSDVYPGYYADSSVDLSSSEDLGLGPTDYPSDPSANDPYFNSFWDPYAVDAQDPLTGQSSFDDSAAQQQQAIDEYNASIAAASAAADEQQDPLTGQTLSDESAADQQTDFAAEYYALPPGTQSLLDPNSSDGLSDLGRNGLQWLKQSGDTSNANTLINAAKLIAGASQGGNVSMSASAPITNNSQGQTPQQAAQAAALATALAAVTNAVIRSGQNNSAAPTTTTQQQQPGALADPFAKLESWLSQKTMIASMPNGLVAGIGVVAAIAVVSLSGGRR